MQVVCVVTSNIETPRFGGACFNASVNNVIDLSVNLKPYALVTISTNNSGKYGKIIDNSQKKKCLIGDVADCFLRFEHTFWNTNQLIKNVSYHDRFHGIGFVEKLEPNPHVHILLF